jgi:hypothetical protein
MSVESVDPVGEIRVLEGVTVVRTRSTGDIRKIPLIITAVLWVVCVLIELSSSFLKTNAVTPSGIANTSDAPGLGIPYIALVDGLLAYTLVMMVLTFVLNANVQAKLQAILTLILSFFLVLGSIALIFVALAKLLLMIALFFAIPFGTIIYLAIWGAFPKGAAAAVLSLLMLLKIIASICLPIAHQRFLVAKGLILMILTSFLCMIIVSFLHGIVPTPLVSITDALAAIIVGIIALIWGIIVLVGAIIATVQALTTA